jgi:hypothetical protein
LAAVVAVIVRGEAWFHWFIVMLQWNGLCSIATVVGGVIVRTCRYRTATRSSGRLTKLVCEPPRSRSCRHCWPSRPRKTGSPLNDHRWQSSSSISSLTRIEPHFSATNVRNRSLIRSCPSR